MLVAQAGGRGVVGWLRDQSGGVEGSQQLGCADGHGRQSRPGEPSSGPHRRAGKRGRSEWLVRGVSSRLFGVWDRSAPLFFFIPDAGLRACVWPACLATYE